VPAELMGCAAPLSRASSLLSAAGFLASVHRLWVTELRYGLPYASGRALPCVQASEQMLQPHFTLVLKLRWCIHIQWVALCRARRHSDGCLVQVQDTL
jgi:hypothetical protein